MSTGKVPEVVIRRLPVYLRVLEELIESGADVVSSGELSQRTGHSSEQIRKDLAYFGAFGTRGVGYRPRSLAVRLEEILRLDRERRVVLVGAGNLGTSLARYLIERPRRVRLVAVFDRDDSRIGRSISGVTIQTADGMADAVRTLGARIGIIAVPGNEAQGVADDLIEGGVGSILNFSRTKLRERPDCFVRDIDIMLELQSLSFYVTEESPN